MNIAEISVIAIIGLNILIGYVGTMIRRKNGNLEAYEHDSLTQLIKKTKSIK